MSWTKTKNINRQKVTTKYQMYKAADNWNIFFVVSLILHARMMPFNDSFKGRFK